MSRSWEDMLSNPIEGERYKGESVILGYSYEDIQAFGNSLTWAIDSAKSQGEEQQYKQLLIVWDFFEGLLGEGYIAEEISVND